MTVTSLFTDVEGNTPFLTWEIPWTEEPGGLQSVELKESNTT